ncbi:MAG: ribbon-helix-helix domain-containing protein [Methanomassiliicoccaceae archaeon]|nr:ribbon-helix-helix domain-containing protein [Methanomassiliicoccaceae archaeon]
MGNKVKTEVVSIQLPSKLVKRIDKQIMVTEEYSNRPDFILTAMRNYFEDFEGFFYLENREYFKIIDIQEGTYDPVVEEEVCKQKAEKNAKALDNISTLRKIYSDFKGGPTVRAVIRIPIGFRNRWDEIKKLDVDIPIDNYLEFIRLSIITLVKNPKQEVRVILSDLSPQSMQEAIKAKRSMKAANAKK